MKVSLPQLHWPAPPSNTVVPENEAHVWAASPLPADADVEHHTTLLAPDEISRAARFRMSADRARFIAGRGILRVILSRYLGQPPGEVRLSHGRNGKPRLASERGNRPPRGLHFNLSHSGDVVLCAMTCGGEIGVDVERLVPMPEADRIASRFFSAEERLALSRVSPDERLQEFFRIWTRREAMLKATGVGVGDDVEAVAGSGVCVADLPAPAAGYVAALAVHHATCRIRLWRFCH